jgi:hypothetical protein
MTQYLISFPDGAMDFPEEVWPDVGKATRELVQEALNAGVWVFSAGLESQRASVVATDGMVTDGPYPETKEVIGGFAVVDVPSREEATPQELRGPAETGPSKLTGAGWRPDDVA